MDTILDTIYQRAKGKPDTPAIMHKSAGRWIQVPWWEFYDRIESLAYALNDLGLEPSDRIGILSWTRPEWTVTDLAGTMSGLIVVPLYPQSPASDCEYILHHAEIKFLFCEDSEQLEKIGQIRSKLPHLQRVAVFDPSGIDRTDVLSFTDLVRTGRDLKRSKQGLIEDWLDKVRPDDPMTIIYTSGTTGPPKGAVLPSRGFLFNAQGVYHAMGAEEGQLDIAYLPLAHVYERFMQYSVLNRGMVYCFAESIDKLVDNLGEIRPHAMPGVPRVYEKAYSAVKHKIEHSSPQKRRLANWALEVGRKVVEAHLEERPTGLCTRFQYALADRLVFKKIRQTFGGRLRFAPVAAAPVSYEMAVFFMSIGIPLLEAWGMTETTAPVTINPREEVRPGTAGPPFPGVSIKLDEDGEILIRGPNLLLEYYKDEKATQEAFTQDGYFRTGDLGRFDDHGYLKIVGRKKDILINAYGKNIAVHNVEKHFMTDPLFAGCIIFGDSKPYLTAVMSLSEEMLAAWAKTRGLEGKTYSELVELPEVRDLVQSRIDAIDAELAKYERVKKFILADHVFSIDTGEMTPTLKLKRNVVISNYQPQLEALYD